MGWDRVRKEVEEAEHTAPVSRAHHLAKLLRFPGWEASCTKGAFLGGSRFWAESQSCCRKGGEGEGSAPQLLVVPTFNCLPLHVHRTTPDPARPLAPSTSSPSGPLSSQIHLPAGKLKLLLQPHATHSCPLHTAVTQEALCQGNGPQDSHGNLKPERLW